MTPSWSHQTHSLPSEVIWSWGRCWWLGGINPKFLAFRILKIDPLFIAIQCRNDFLFCLANRIWHRVFWRRSICLSFSSCGTHFPIFWTFSMACSRMEMAAWETPNCSASIFCDWVSSSSKRTYNWQSSTFLGRFSRFLSLRSKLSSLRLGYLNHWTGETNLCTLFPSIKHCRHRPPQAFDAIRQPISSNWNRKSKLLAYAFFLAKN